MEMDGFESNQAVVVLHMRNVPLAADVNLEDLARVTPGFSGADLENLVNEAALAAARRGSAQVSRQDFEHALDKLLLGGRREALMDERERRTVAYHEGGHVSNEMPLNLLSLSLRFMQYR